MELQLTKTATAYRVDIEVEEMEAILDAERFPAWNYKDTLFSKLDGIRGISSTEYEGHFGPAIYFNVDADHDTYNFGQRILAKIRLHIKACQKFNKQQAKVKAP